MVDRQPQRIIYYYNTWQKVFDGMEHLVDEFRRGVPSKNDIEALKRFPQGSLVIIDDAMHNTSSELAEIFSVTSRHSKVSLVFMTQNLFPRDPHFRNISRQANYIVLMKNPRDIAAVRFLARQMKPENPSMVVEAYADATAKPYSYLFVDMHQEAREELRFVTSVFPDEYTIAYARGNL